METIVKENGYALWSDRGHLYAFPIEKFGHAIVLDHTKHTPYEIIFVERINERNFIFKTVQPANLPSELKLNQAPYYKDTSKAKTIKELCELLRKSKFVKAFKGTNRHASHNQTLDDEAAVTAGVGEGQADAIGVTESRIQSLTKKLEKLTNKKIQLVESEEIETEKIFKNPPENPTIINKICWLDYGDLKQHYQSNIANFLYDKKSAFWNTDENVKIGFFNIKNIIPTQEVLYSDSLNNKKDEKYIPVGILMGGKIYLLDGHHKVASEILQGAEKIKVKVFVVNN